MNSLVTKMANPVQTFVVPVGDYFKSMAALNYAIKRTGPRDDIILFHVDSETPNNASAHSRPKVRPFGDPDLSNLLKRCREENRQCRYLTERFEMVMNSGQVVNAICDVAISESANEIVVGARRSGSYPTVLADLGQAHWTSISQGVVSRCQACPIVVVRVTEADTK